MVQKGANTVEGSEVAIRVDHGSVILSENSKIAKADVVATNGVIHVIDHAMLPPDLKL